MQTIETLQRLLDEIKVIAEINRNLPNKYKEITTQKINDLNGFIINAHTTETDLLKYEIPKDDTNFLDELANKYNKKRKSN